MDCIFNYAKCTHSACCESQDVACCHACNFKECATRCKKGVRVEGEIPEEIWEKIVEMQEAVT